MNRNGRTKANLGLLSGTISFVASFFLLVSPAWAAWSGAATGAASSQGHDDNRVWTAKLSPQPATLTADDVWLTDGLNAQGDTAANGWHINLAGALSGNVISIRDYYAWTGNNTPVITNRNGTQYGGGAVPNKSGGAVWNLDYNPAAGDPSGTTAHWIQALRTNSPTAHGTNHGFNAGGGYYEYLDNEPNMPSPLYDPGYHAGSNWFIDGPSRHDPGAGVVDYDWDARVFVATYTAATRTLTVYDKGIQYGFTYHADKNNNKGGGGGSVDPPLTPTSMDFNRQSFYSFSSTKNIQMDNGTIVSPNLIDFTGRIEFEPTSDPDVYNAHFATMEFMYEPFTIPGTSLIASREVLVPSVLNAGTILNATSGTSPMSLSAPFQWLSPDGQVVANSFELFDMTLTVTSPGVNQLDFQSNGSFTKLTVGDFNGDGTVNAVDIDLLYAHLGGSPALYDLTGDGVVDQADVTYLLQNILHTNYGDANLDTYTDFPDFQILLDHWNVSGGWAQADFTGDGIVDFLDFQKLLDYWNPSGWSFAPAQTPEPATLSLLALGGLALLRRRK